MTSVAGPFWPQEHHLNKLGKGPLGDASLPSIKALCLVVSDKKFFSCFSDVANVTPRVGPFLAPGA